MNWSGETRENETRKGKPIQGCLRELVSTVGKWNQSPGVQFLRNHVTERGKGNLTYWLLSPLVSLLWEC